MSHTDHECSVCEAATLRTVAKFSTLPRVTSDCKPWPEGGELAVCETCGMIQKLPTPKWFTEIGQIYHAYEIYHQSDGAEQPIFRADGSAVPRSRLLVDYVAQRLRRTGNTGSLIDVGCGNGAALRNFSAALPGWSFDGTELSDRAAPLLRQIPGFGQLHTGALSEILRRYDVVTMIHSLEHIPNPAAALHDSLSLLKPDGALFIEVPDVETSPFDLLVADHRSHFSRTTLQMLAARQSIRVDVLENTVLPKEITFIGRRGNASRIPAEPARGIRIVEQTVKWLHDVLEAAAGAAKSANFGIFGSSISAVWLYGALRDRVRFFVDEDSARAGRQLDGRPILAPSEVPPESTVFVPLVERVAAPLVRRLSHLRANFVLPS